MKDLLEQIRQSAMEQLDQTVRENLGQVTLVDGAPDGGGVPVL